MYKSWVDKPCWRPAFWSKPEHQNTRTQHGRNALTALEDKSFNPKNVRKKRRIYHNITSSGKRRFINNMMWFYCDLISINTQKVVSNIWAFGIFLISQTFSLNTVWKKILIKAECIAGKPWYFITYLSLTSKHVKFSCTRTHLSSAREKKRIPLHNLMAIVFLLTRWPFAFLRHPVCEKLKHSLYLSVHPAFTFTVVVRLRYLNLSLEK